MRTAIGRRRHPELRRGHYGGLDFHGPAPGAPDFSDASRLVAWSLGDGAGGGLYIAFNASHRPQVVALPHWPGRAWRLVADTGKARRIAEHGASSSTAAPGRRRVWCPTLNLPLGWSMLGAQSLSRHGAPLAHCIILATMRLPHLHLFDAAPSV